MRPIRPGLALPLLCLFALIGGCAPGVATPPPTEGRPTAVALVPPLSASAPIAPTATDVPAPTATSAPLSSPTPALATGAPALPMTHTPLQVLTAWGEGAPAAAVYSPDGALVAVATTLRLQLRDAASLERVIWESDLAVAPTALAYSPDAQTLALAAGEWVELHAAESGDLVSVLDLGTTAADLAFAPDGALLAVTAGERVTLWDPARRELLRELSIPAADPSIGPAGAMLSVAFAADGTMVAGGDLNGNVVLWRVADGSVAQAFSVGLRVVADVAFSPDGATVAAASEGWRAEPGAAWLWDIASGAELRWLTLDDQATFLAPGRRLAFAPDGAELALGTADGTLLRWNTADGTLLEQRAGRGGAITALAYAPDGRALLSAGRDGGLQILGADGAVRARADLSPALSALAVTSTGDLAIAGCEDGSLLLIRPDGELDMRFEAHAGPINDLALSHDGTLLASAGDDGVVRLWALPSGEPRGKLRGHEGPVMGVALAADGTLLASAGYDGTVHLWRLPSGELARTISVLESDGLSATAVLDLALSPDGVTLAATADSGILRLYQVADGAKLRDLTFPDAAWVVRAAFSADGQRLAAIDERGRVALLPIDGGTPVLAAEGGVTDLIWLSDRMLLTASGTTLRLWAARGDGLKALAAAPAPETLVAATALEVGLVATADRGGIVTLRALR